VTSGTVKNDENLSALPINFRQNGRNKFITTNFEEVFSVHSCGLEILVASGVVLRITLGDLYVSNRPEADLPIEAKMRSGSSDSTEKHDLLIKI